MPKQLVQYRLRYIQAVRLIMSDRNIEHYRDISKTIGVPHQTLSAILQERQYPTVQHGIDLCSKCGYSADWLFLGKGVKMQIEQATLNRILKAVQKK